jgi:predicted TIM-barrel fold metal-dependent hydrolase
MTGAEPVLPVLPPGSCDCQVHVFAGMDRYPPLERRNYDPPAVTAEDFARIRVAAGIERAVIAQATIYGTDHRLLLDTLKGNPQYRGVAVVNDGVSQDDLMVMHRAGIRAARFGLGSSIQVSLSREEFHRSVARIQDLGWHLRIAASGDDLARHESWLRDLTLPAVLDHLAGADPRRGLDQPGCELALDLLRKPHWWILLSNGDRRSVCGYPWDDMLPFARAFHAAAPDRTLWASDWPHVLYANPKVPSLADLLGFLWRAVPDEAAFKGVLAGNPARLYGFDI